MRLSFATWGIPDPEWQGAWELACKINDLHSYADQFDYAVALFDEVEPRKSEHAKTRPAMDTMQQHSKKLQMLNGWLFIAARDAAMIVYHVRSTLHSIKSNVRNCPSVLKRTSIPILESALSTLETNFPNLVMLRHAVAHDADTSFSPESRAKHALNSESFTDLLLGGNLEGRKFIYGREGKILSMLIASSETAKLRAIADLACSAFKYDMPQERPE